MENVREHGKAHLVFAGNRVDKKTVKEILDHLKKRFQIKRCVFVGDRGLISKENLAELEEATFDSILALRKRRNQEVRDLLLSDAPCIYCIESEDLWWREVKGKEGLRYIVCYNPQMGAEQKEKPEQDMNHLKKELQTLEEKISASKKRYSAKTLVRRIEAVLSHKHGRRVIDYRVDEKKHTFTHWEKAQALQLEERLDGVYILRTKEGTLSPLEIIEAYKDLADVERAFRVMKSVLDLRPFWHRTEDRVRAHAMICYLAFLIEKYIDCCLKKAGMTLSAPHALESLKHIGAAQMEVNGQCYTYISRSTTRHMSIFKAVGVNPPTLCWMETA